MGLMTFLKVVRKQRNKCLSIKSSWNPKIFLYAPNIPIGVADGIKEVYNESFSYSQKDFDAKLIKEGLGAYDWSSLRLFSRMVMENQRTLVKQGA
jgi:hypothetical protein